MARTRMGHSNKRRRILGGDPKPWGDMDSRFLRRIFEYLDADELVFAASLVCHSWRSSSWEVLFWKNDQTLDLTNLKCLARNACPNMSTYDEIDHINIFKTTYPDKLLNAMEYFMFMDPYFLGNGQRCIRNIIVPPNMFFSGLEDLTFLAKRSPNLKSLVLKNGYGLRDGCFSEALKYWKFMEDISIGPVYQPYMVHILTELETNCKNLHKLHISDYFELKLGNAELIAKLLQLREFSMTRGAATKAGLSMILSQCRQISKFTLKSLYVIPRKKDKIYIHMEKRIITNMAGGDEYIKWCVKYFWRNLHCSKRIGLGYLFRREIINEKRVTWKRKSLENTTY